MEYFPGQKYDGLKKFGHVLKAVMQGEADYAMIPVENSSAGRVAEVYSLLPSVGDLHIVGEYLLPIHHCLVVPKRALPGKIRL
jgi:prephenate dehydratase